MNHFNIRNVLAMAALLISIVAYLVILSGCAATCGRASDGKPPCWGRDNLNTVP